MKNPRNCLGSAGCNLTYSPEQPSKITTRWRHQTVIKEREIKVDNFRGGEKMIRNLYIVGHYILEISIFFSSEHVRIIVLLLIGQA